MIHILWEFRIRNEKRAEFEKHYAGNGSWAKLFSKARGYRATRLLKEKGASGRYVTIDAWDDAECFEAFKAEFGREYEELDKVCEELTEDERKIGVFEEV